MNAAEMGRLLQKGIQGDVLWEEYVRKFYSADASSYRIVPKVVIIPKNENDVIYAVKFAKKHQKSITSRGSGTGLVGGALNRGIILDMQKFDSVRIGGKYVQVGAGTKKGILDEKLEKSGKFFPPNPSVGRYCSIGGMLGNNASGSRSLKYGSMIDNVIEITFIDGNGKKIILPQDMKTGKRILALAKRIDMDMIPTVTKNSSGYRIEHATSMQDTQKVIVGSEGTLGIILSAKLKITDVPENRVLYIIEYDSASDAACDCSKILDTKPSAVEFVDAITLEGFGLGFDDKTKCLLFVEYDSGMLGKDIKHHTSGRIKKRVSSEKEIKKWWKMRNLSLHFSIKSIKPKDRFPHIIEDAVVPIENLAKLFEIIEDLNRKFSTETITYGHAGNGNIHVRLMADRQDSARIKKIAKYYFDKIIHLGGSITGEHGDGLARTEFVKVQYGVKNYEIFKQLKDLFDPHNILNPGKVISEKSTMAQNLEGQV